MSHLIRQFFPIITKFLPNSGILFASMRLSYNISFSKFRGKMSIFPLLNTIDCSFLNTPSQFSLIFSSKLLYLVVKFLYFPFIPQLRIIITTSTCGGTEILYYMAKRLPLNSTTICLLPIFYPFLVDSYPIYEISPHIKRLYFFHPLQINNRNFQI